MKKILLITIGLMSFSSFADTVFKCKEAKAISPTYLAVSATSAYFGSEYYYKDTTYVPGNNGKKYDRFINESSEILVPILMTRNKTNQGVVVYYSAEGKIRFSCLK